MMNLVVRQLLGSEVDEVYRIERKANLERLHNSPLRTLLPVIKSTTTRPSLIPEIRFKSTPRGTSINSQLGRLYNVNSKDSGDF